MIDESACYETSEKMSSIEIECNSCTKPDDSSSDCGCVSEVESPNVPTIGTWGMHGLSNDPWNDKKKPVVRLFHYEDLKLTDEEKPGKLTDRIIAAGSSYLDRCPETGKYVLCKCTLPKKGLLDISALAHHHYLQYLDLSWNKLTNLSPLSELPFLMHLDVSHNLLTELLNFKPPLNLTHVDYSHNKVYDIRNLSKFWSIVRLNLSHNELYIIRGLENLRYLQHLDLSHNFVRHIENLSRLKLVELHLEHNSLISFEIGALTSLKSIEFVDVSHNGLRSLKLFENVRGIRRIEMESNDVDDLLQLNYLSNLQFLTEINFRNNPICLAENYLETCVLLIGPIMTVNGRRVTAIEKVETKDKFRPSPRQRAMEMHSQMLLLDQMNNFTPGILPVDEDIPGAMVLVGPPESKNDQLAGDVCKKYSSYAALGLHHTTRPKLPEEVDGESYRFVSDDEFNELILTGAFAFVSEHFGHSYGLAIDEMVKATEPRRILVTHSNLVGAVKMKMSHANTRFVLVVPGDDDEQLYRDLLEKYYFDRRKSTRGGDFVKITNNPKSEASPGSEIAKILSELLHNVEHAEMKQDCSVKFSEAPHRTCPGSESTDCVSSCKLTECSADEEVTSKPGGEEEIGSGSTYTQESIPNEEIQKIFRDILDVGKIYVDFNQDHPGFLSATEFETINRLIDEVVNISDKILHDSEDQKPGRQISVKFSNVIKSFAEQDSMADSDESSFSKSLPPEREEESAGLVASDEYYSVSEMKFEEEPYLSVVSDFHLRGYAAESMEFSTLRRGEYDPNDDIGKVFRDLVDAGKTYQEFHRENPGFFCQTVSVDKPIDAMTKLGAILKEIVTHPMKASREYDYGTDPEYDAMMNGRLESLNEDIRKCMDMSLD